MPSTPSKDGSTFGAPGIRGAPGFTLTELVTSVAISSLVAVTVLRLSQSTESGYDTVRSASRTVEKIRDAMRCMRQELASSSPDRIEIKTALDGSSELEFQYTIGQSGGVPQWGALDQEPSSLGRGTPKLDHYRRFREVSINTVGSQTIKALRMELLDTSLTVVDSQILVEHLHDQTGKPGFVVTPNGIGWDITLRTHHPNAVPNEVSIYVVPKNR